ncbi:MAG: sterol desaturase family protein [Planctomycetota bacterium]
MDTFVDLLLGSRIPYITYAVPVFFLLIGVELLVAWMGRRSLYRFNDSINDLSCGILQTVSAVFTVTLLTAAYLFLYARFAQWDMRTFSPAGKWACAIVLFLGVDFCYYWFHRLSHEINAAWAAHAVHHQSEEYNLTVALRQGTFQPFFSWVFYLPLAVLGFPPEWFAAMSSFNTLYQFWIHTRAIGKLGPLEWVLNTPSHHRVHHGRNPKYLDKNHAGTLIIWDRMFGTFQEEEEEPVYGIVRPLASWNPLWANVHEYVEIYETAKAAPFWFDKVKIWFMPPGWTPRGLPEHPPTPEVTAATVRKYDAKSSASMSLYIFIHFVLTLFLGVYVMASKSGSVSLVRLAGPALLVAFGLLNFGAILESRPWISWAEPMRLLTTVLVITFLFDGSTHLPFVVFVASVTMLGSWCWFLAFRSKPESLADPIAGAMESRAH